jgi:hypothetical protein
MSAKSCQLCGKALGRMRVGGDGDFCSREHRNQFRLRKGMDRLQEANKVASLMRRRENPRQMLAAQLISTPVMERRGALKSAPFPERHPLIGFAALRPALYRPEVPRRDRHLSVPAGPRTPTERRELTLASFLDAARARPKPMRSARKISKSEVRIPHGSAVRTRFPVSGPADAPRESSALLHMNRRASFEVLDVGMEAPGPAYIQKVCRFQMGVAVRTIATAQKTLPGPCFERRIPSQRASRRFSKPRSGSLVAAPLRSVALASVAISTEPLPCTVPSPERDLRIPSLPYRVSANALGQQGCLAPGGAAASAESPAERSYEGFWETRMRANSVWLPSAALRPAALSGRGWLNAPAALGLGDRYRLAEVPFAGSDWTFDYKPIALQGFLSAPPRVATAPVAPVGLEEDFNSGLARWTGETGDWRLDAAGARPAGLALFQPSLALSDYDFEFLARIEHRGMTFVFRASNHSNYHKVTLGLAESGRYELRRSVVIGGIEEPAVVSPLGEIIRAGSAFTVKIGTRRNDFAISLEGEAVSHWTDGRLPAGGIGFTALRGDRARVYWVRVAPLGGPNSEAANGRLPRSIQ